MANTKTIVTRIKNKIDTLDKWSSYTGTLLDGEIALVRVPTGDKTNPLTGKSEPVWELLMKVGNGTDSFADLPWLNAKSSDVYNWAKKQNLELGDMPLDALLTELQKTFYTESEVDALLAGKSDNHNHPYLPDTTTYAGSSTKGGAATSANKVNKAVTFNNSGSGVASGTTFDGSTARTISYNTIGAAPASHNHNDIYYTESEVDALLGGKSDNHDHPYLPDTTVYAKGASQNGAAVSANKVNKSVTFKATDGATAGSTFDGSAAVTVSYATVGAAPASHNHDDRYYTESEIDSKLAGKSDNHDHPYLPDSTTYAGSSTKGGAANKVANKMTVKLNSGTTEGTNLFTFDGSAAKTIDITPATIGASASGHNHDDKYYTESEIDSKITVINQAIDGKSASGHTHDDRYYTETEVDDKIAAAVSSALKYKGTKSTTAQLPTSGNATGDVWNVTSACAASGTLPKVNAGDNVAWNGSAWDVLAGTVDLSGYYTSAQVDAELAKKSDNHNHPYLPDTTTYAGSSTKGGAANSVKAALTFSTSGDGATNGTTFNGSTARTISYNSVGAAPASHTHDDRYYTESEIDSKLAGKSDTHGHPYLPDSTKYAGSATKGGAANSVANSFKVQLNGGTTEGTNQFTFNGAAAKSVDITPSSIGAAQSSHSHDDRYYTESEIDSKLAGKANTSHGTHVPTPETADNAKFLRNDNTWQKVTPANIGAAPAIHTHTKSQITDFAHTHDDRYYTESEIDEKLAKKSDNHDHPYLPDTTLYAGSSTQGGKANGAVTADKVASSLTFNNGGSGAASGTTFNGSAAKTISYNTIGAAAAGHTHSGYESRLTDLEETYISYTQIGTSGTYQMHLGDDTSNVIIFDCGGAE